MQEVRVSGHLDLANGCTLSEFGYSIDDEYGIYTGTGTFSITEAGPFDLAIPVEGSRLGQDSDGRHYKITLYAVDEMGPGVSADIDV
jgi:hypothetical protein